jgi:hypothetical protein
MRSRRLEEVLGERMEVGGHLRDRYLRHSHSNMS